MDGSTDESAEVIRNEAEGLNYRLIEQENSGRSVVRNRGAKEANGDLLIFFDDDMLPEAGCIQAHVEHHTIHKQSILTGAQIDLEGDDRTDLQNFKAVLTQRWSKSLIEKNGQRLAGDELFITAANFSIHRQTFLELDGFDEQLTDAEDFDMAVRAGKHGIPLYYQHKAFAWHNDSITARSYIKRLRQYRKAHQKLRSLKPGLYKDESKFVVPELKGARKILFGFFANSYWMKQLENGGWVTVLPTKIRYKIYDWVITSNGVFFPDKVVLE